MKKVMSTLLAGGVLALAACAPVASPPVQTTPQAAIRTAPAAPVSFQEQARQQVAVHLQAGRHQAALEVIEKERRRSGSQRFLQEEQLQVLGKLALEVEAFFQTGEYERSGRSLALILNYYPQDQSAADRLGIGRQDLQDRLELCAERLMSKGLADYRVGDLPAAIDTWKKILTFHGAHDGARRGIQTAEIQLQNLRALQ